MQNNAWSRDNLKQLLIRQHAEYLTLGEASHSDYQSDDKLFRTWLTHELKLLSFIPEECQTTGTKVIDVGGGVGRLCSLLSDLGLQCVNLDMMFTHHDPQENPRFSLLKSYLENKGVTIAASDINVDGTPFADNTFDLAISSEVIEHLPNSPKPMLSDIYRVLKKGGWFILTTPNFAAIGQRARALLGYSTRGHIAGFYNMELYPVGTPFRGHNREYIIDEVTYMLSQENFNIIKIETFNLIPDLTTFIDLLKRYPVSTMKYSLKLIIYCLIENLFKHLNNYIIVLARK